MSTRLGLLLTSVFVVSTALSYVVWKHEVRSPLNLIWMLGFPAALAVYFKKTAVDRLALGALLALASFLGIGQAAYLIGYP